GRVDLARPAQAVAPAQAPVFIGGKMACEGRVAGHGGSVAPHACPLEGARDASLRPCTRSTKSRQGVEAATGLAAAGFFAAAGLAAPPPTTMRSRFRSTVFKPTPLTLTSSSALLNAPLALR